MLISYRHGFIFIHVYKNAGMSIARALGPFAKKNPGPFHAHVSAAEVVERLGRERFRSLFSFAFVRNPWDWQVSQYCYMLLEKRHFQHGLVKGLGSFGAYVKWRCDNDVRFQKDLVCSDDGEALVDFVGRFERLEDDFRSICSRIGVSAVLPRLNVSNRVSYRDFYDEETRELVGRTFAPDIDLFGYGF